MDADDIVDREVISRVRAVTSSQARRVVAVAVLAGLIGGALVASLVYWDYGSLAKAAVMLVTFLLLGLWQAVHWGRHYRNILGQLKNLEQRVASGEVVYGSQVRFHSYR